GSKGALSPKQLGEYKRKRDPKKTPEPFGSRKRSGEPILVVQRHDARRLYYDFRLERDGALASWAVPKGLPLQPGQQRLAVHVEDHPLEYALFEGEIPQGQYGAGTVEIWDRGTYELLDEKRGGGLTVRLDGERLEGTWALIPAKLDGDPKNWLLIRKKDQGPTAPEREYAPMLASLADELPRGPGWLFEVKWDGYRIVARLSAGDARLRTRKDQDYTERFAGVAREEAVAAQGLEGVIAKRADSRYEPGRRSRYWLKKKTRPSQEFIVAGYTKGEGRRSAGFGSLVLAVREGRKLRYVGNVGTG